MRMRRDRLCDALLALCIAFILSAAITDPVIAALPQSIIYTSSDGSIVKANYQMAIDKATDGDMEMITAVKAKLAQAQDNFWPIVVVTTDGKNLDWAKALDDSKSFIQAQTMAQYLLSNAPIPTQFLQPDGTVGSTEPGTAIEEFMVISIE